MRWFLIGFAFVLVAVTGMVAGATLSGSGDSASAASTQPREDQIALGAAGAANDPTYNYVPVIQNPWILLDASDYPSSSVFRLEAVIDLGAGQTTCVRLFDLTATSDIPGSTMCGTGDADGKPQRLRSDPLALPTGEHEYTLQGQSPMVSGGSYVQFSRIIAEWNEPLVMNPSPNAVGGMVELLSGSNEGGLGRLPELAAALLLLGVGGMYVVKTRRD